MPRRTPDQGVQPFERRAGTEEIPRWRGMNRSADPSAIPLNQFHLAVNVRIQPGDLQDRPGLEEVIDTESGVCVTGIIETQENSGNPGGQIRGLIAGIYNQYKVAGKDYLFHLAPNAEDGATPDVYGYPSTGRGLISRKSTSYSVYTSFWPVGRTRAYYDGPTAVFVFNPTLVGGPFKPFVFQGNTCVLGILGSGATAPVTIFALAGKDDGSPGAMNAVAVLSPQNQMAPYSCAVRKEIINGEIKEVLYIAGLKTGPALAVWRFDGTTLTEWFAPVHPAPGSLHIYADGQEIVILHNSSALDDGNANIYYQPYPGAAVSASVLPGNLFEDVAGYDDGGWTGACRYRGTWYVFFEGGNRQPTGGVPRTPFGGVISAVGGGATLTFAQVFKSGPGVHLDATTYWNVGNPIVWNDKIVFHATPTLNLDSNGNWVWFPENGTFPGPNFEEMRLGTFDGSTWTVPAVVGTDVPDFVATAFFNGYYESNHAWHLVQGNRYINAVNDQALDGGGSGVRIGGLIAPAGIELEEDVYVIPTVAGEIGGAVDGYPISDSAEHFGGGEE